MSAFALCPNCSFGMRPLPKGRWCANCGRDERPARGVLDRLRGRRDPELPTSLVAWEGLIVEADAAWTSRIAELEQNLARVAEQRRRHPASRLATAEEAIGLALDAARQERVRLGHQRAQVAAERDLLTLWDIEAARDAGDGPSRSCSLGSTHPVIDWDPVRRLLLLYRDGCVDCVEYGKGSGDALTRELTFVVRSQFGPISPPSWVGFLGDWVGVEWTEPSSTARRAWCPDTGVVRAVSGAVNPGALELASPGVVAERAGDGWRRPVDLRTNTWYPPARRVWEHADFLLFERAGYIDAYQRSAATLLWSSPSLPVEAAVFVGEAFYTVERTKRGRRLVVRQLCTDPQRRVEPLVGVEEVRGIAVSDGLVALWNEGTVWVREAGRHVQTVVHGEGVGVTLARGVAVVRPPRDSSRRPFAWANGKETAPPIGLGYDTRLNFPEPRVQATPWWVNGTLHLTAKLQIFGSAGWDIAWDVQVRAFDSLALLLRTDEPGASDLRASLTAVAENATRLVLALQPPNGGDVETDVRTLDDLRLCLRDSCATIDPDVAREVATSLARYVRVWFTNEASALDRILETETSVDTRVRRVREMLERIAPWRLMLVQQQSRPVGWLELDQVLSELDTYSASLHGLVDAIVGDAAVAAVSAVSGLPSVGNGAPSLRARFAPIAPPLDPPGFEPTLLDDDDRDRRIREQVDRLRAEMAAIREIEALDGTR